MRSSHWSPFLFLVGATQAFADFIPLGDLPGGIFYSDVRGVSADGMVAVGQSNSEAGFEAFRWTQAGGMVGLRVLECGSASIAAGTSADGAVVVGISGSSISQGAEGFRWTQADGMVGLGLLPGGTDSFVNGVSADGRVVVGMANDASRFQAIRWTQESGMVSLGADLGAAFAASADGSVIVGETSSGVIRAFRWTEAGVTVLGSLSGSGGGSNAVGVSADGSVIVGGSSSASGFVPYRWTEATGMVSLGLLPGDTGGVAFGVSADGSVITGQTNSTSGGDRAFVWDSTNRMRDLREVLISQGDDLSGWTLTDARGISADGRVIIGHGINPAGQEESWLARLTGLARVSIDIEPGSDANPINPGSRDRISVAILTTHTFDATTVNAATMLFGTTGTEAAFVKAAAEDVNADGRPDLLLDFNTQDTGIQCGATSAFLKGETIGAEPIEGSDSIKTVECIAPPAPPSSPASPSPSAMGGGAVDLVSLLLLILAFSSLAGRTARLQRVARERVLTRKP